MRREMDLFEHRRALVEREDEEGQAQEVASTDRSLSKLLACEFEDVAPR